MNKSKSLHKKVFKDKDITKNKKDNHIHKFHMLSQKRKSELGYIDNADVRECRICGLTQRVTYIGGNEISGYKRFYD